MHHWGLALLVLGACASAGEYPTEEDDDAPIEVPDAAEPEPVDASSPPPVFVDAALPGPVDAAPPPVDAAPLPIDAAPPPSFLCVSHVQCNQAAHECCAFLPPDFTSGICGYGNIVLGACLLSPRPDAGP